MRNLQSFQNISGFSNTNAVEAVVTLQSYIKSLSGLVAYYPMDETSGTTAVNQAPDTLGTLDGTITGATINQAGQSGTAYSFDNINDLVDCGNNAAFQITTGTIGAFMKADAALGVLTNAVVSKENAYSMFVDNLLFKTYSWAGSTGFRSSAIDVVTDQIWHSVAMSFISGSTNNCLLYLDGVLVLTTTITIQSNAQSLRIGDSAISDHVWHGLIQHAFVCNAVVPASNILSIAQLAGIA